MSDKPSLEELYCSNAGIKTLNIVSNPNLYSLRCENNYLTELDMTVCGELWFENAILSLNRVVYGKSENGKRTFDVSSIMLDLSRIQIADNPNYIYDPSSGILVLNQDTEAEIAYIFT